MLSESKWYQGYPPIEAVSAHEAASVDIPSGTIRVNWTEGEADTKLVSNPVEVEDLFRYGLWICLPPDDFFSWQIGTRIQRKGQNVRLAHLRVVEGVVVSSIGFCHEWIPLERTKWGPVSRFLPVQMDGTPIGWKA